MKVGIGTYDRPRRSLNSRFPSIMEVRGMGRDRNDGPNPGGGGKRNDQPPVRPGKDNTPPDRGSGKPQR